MLLPQKINDTTFDIFLYVIIYVTAIISYNQIYTNVRIYLFQLTEFVFFFFTLIVQLNNYPGASFYISTLKLICYVI